MSARPRASQLTTSGPSADISLVKRPPGPPHLAAYQATPTEHPSPAIGFLIAGAFGAVIWAGVAALLLL